MKLKSAIDKLLVATITLLLLSIAITVYVSLKQSARVNETSKQVTHTQDVLLQSERILSLMVDNETGSRGYILTGNKVFLEPYFNSKKEIYPELNKLNKLTQYNPVQQKRIDSLRYYIDKRISFSENTVSTYETKGTEAAISLIETSEGRTYSDNVRKLIYKIQGAENILLAQQKELNNIKTENLNNILRVIILTILVLLFFFIQKLRSDFLTKRMAAASLLKLNNELEQRVSERTKELSDSKQVLSQTFERITDAFTALDRNWCYTYMNKKAGEVFHCDPEQMIGKNIWDVFPADIDRPFYKAYHKALETQQYINLEAYYPSYDVWFENHIYPSPDGLSVYARDITEKKKAQEKVKANEEKYHLLIDRISDGFIALDTNWRYIYANKRIGEITGMDPQTLIGKIVWEVFPDAVNSDTYRLFHKAMEQQHYIYHVDYFEPLDLWQENHIYPSPDGISVFIKDITEKKKAEEKLIKANRLYYFISQVNQMIVRTTNQETLFEEACQIAVQAGGFRMAWIGLIDENTKRVIPVMHAGENKDYLSKIAPISIEDVDEGMGPTGRSIREGNYIICNDIASDPAMAPWKDAAIGRSYLSSMAIPIIKSGKPVGAFSFYASTKNFFDKTEVDLLQEATNDVAFALEILEKEEMRKNAEQLVLESEMRYQTLTEVSPVGIFHTDASGYTTYVNPRWSQISGLPAEKALGNGWLDAVYETDKIKLSAGWKKATKMEESSMTEYRFIRPDGSITWVMGQAIPERDAANRIIGYVGTITDITERKQTELLIKESEEKYRKAEALGKMGHWELDLKKGLLFWSDEIYRIFDIEKDNNGVQYETFFQSIHPEDRQTFNTLQERVIAGEIKMDFTHRIINRNDEIRYVHELGELVRDKNGLGISLTGTVQDVTEQILAREEIIQTSAQLRQLTGHLQTIREEERKRIGREIHDELGQLLTAIKMDVSWINRKTGEDNKAIKEKLQNVIDLLDGGNLSVRRILNELRPAIMDEYGLQESVKWLGEQFNENTGIPFEFITTDSQIKVTEDIANNVFRIFQEALTNITRYAHAGKVLLSLQIEEKEMLIAIEDDGIGFDREHIINRRSFGIMGMQERVYALKGSFSLTTSPGNGTKIHIRIPLMD